MQGAFIKLELMASQALKARDWRMVEYYAGEMLRRWPDNAEGHYLTGLLERKRKHPRNSIAAFERALECDSTRYDAAVELATQYSFTRQNGQAAAILGLYEPALYNSPLLLDMAGAVYTEIGMAEKAWPLFKRAHELQPREYIFQADLASCAVFLGKIDEAKDLYSALLEKYPDHHPNHYQLSRLRKAKNFDHIDQMKRIIKVNHDSPSRAIPLNFAIAKELEDLGQWDQAFEYYKKGGDAVTGVANYEVQSEIDLIDTIIETCDPAWLKNGRAEEAPQSQEKTPIFVVGLPRTGTTLAERIISSHSRVSSLGETVFLQMVLRRESEVESQERMTPEMITAVAKKEISRVSKGYLESVGYRLGEEPMFIDKLPFNFLYLGFIAKAWPNARIVHLVRNPMDTCFSMYKQLFTWAYLYSYSQENLARYYVAYDRLWKHWQALLGDRMIELEYETLVANQEEQTRRLLDLLELKFEPACLDFDKNAAPSTTASSVQVREKLHADSVKRWKQFENQLEPLKNHLVKAGISVQ